MGTSHLLIAGDFNLPGIDWENDYIEHNEDHLTEFINSVQNCFLFQHVKFPTRYRPGETANILDLIMTNEEGMISDVEHLPGLGKSDHECLSFYLNCNKQFPKHKTPSYNVFKANYAKISNNLKDTNWEALLEGDINEAYTKFIKYIDKEVEGNVPQKTSTWKKNNIFMTPESLKLKDKKNKLWKKYKKSKKEEDLSIYKKIRDSLRCKTRSLRENFENNLTREIKDKSKPF